MSLIEACERGRLDLARQLFEHGKDIHIASDAAFRSAGKNGHLQLAQWLHSLGADIHAENDEAFR